MQARGINSTPCVLWLGALVLLLLSSCSSPDTGYFPRCLRVDAVGFLDLPTRLMLGIRIIKVEQSQWYAPGVGLVKMTRREYAIPNLYPSEYTQALTSFKR